MVKQLKTYLFVLILTSFLSCYSQEKINWVSFEDLEVLQSKQPKKVLLYFHTDWCTYCKKMDRKVFTKSEVIRFLNDNYYSVSFDAESIKEVNFRDKNYINDQVGKSRTPLHQIALALATREGEFVAPTLVILDEALGIDKRYFEYMTSIQLLEVLK